jgi:SET domain-containing protein
MSQSAYNPEIELLLSQLRDTYVKLAPSPIAGIGVFAICDIPKGCRSMFSKDSGEWIEVPRKAVESLPDHIQAMVENYCTFSKESFFIERGGFKKKDLSCFINHSDTPNIAPVNNGEYFEAIMDIRKGEELLIDYGVIADEE